MHLIQYWQITLPTYMYLASFSAVFWHFFVLRLYLRHDVVEQWGPSDSSCTVQYYTAPSMYAYHLQTKSTIPWHMLNRRPYWPLRCCRITSWEHLSTYYRLGTRYTCVLVVPSNHPGTCRRHSLLFQHTYHRKETCNSSRRKKSANHIIQYGLLYNRCIAAAYL